MDYFSIIVLQYYGNAPFLWFFMFEPGKYFAHGFCRSIKTVHAHSLQNCKYCLAFLKFVQNTQHTKDKACKVKELYRNFANSHLFKSTSKSVQNSQCIQDEDLIKCCFWFNFLLLMYRLSINRQTGYLHIPLFV